MPRRPRLPSPYVPVDECTCGSVKREPPTPVAHIEYIREQIRDWLAQCRPSSSCIWDEIMREKEREREKARERPTDRQTDRVKNRESFSVCVCRVSATSRLRSCQTDKTGLRHSPLRHQYATHTAPIRHPSAHWRAENVLELPSPSKQGAII